MALTDPQWHNSNFVILKTLLEICKGLISLRSICTNVSTVTLIIIGYSNSHYILEVVQGGVSVILEVRLPSPVVVVMLSGLLT